MSAPTIPEPALWLEARYDRAQRLRVAYTQLMRRLGQTTDPYTRAAIYRHLDRVSDALTRLGATP